MDEKLLGLIKECFGDNTIFSPKEIAAKREIKKYYSLGSIRTMLCRMSKNSLGEIKRYSNGHYYLSSNIKGTSIPKIPSAYEAIERKYIGLEKENGYYAGETFANMIGLSENLPGVLEIVTNKEKSRGRYVYFGTHKVRIKKPLMKVTKENSPILPILDLLSDREYATSDISLIIDYCKERNISFAKIKRVYSEMPLGARRRCHIGRLINGTI